VLVVFMSDLNYQMKQYLVIENDIFKFLSWRKTFLIGNEFNYEKTAAKSC